MAQRSNNGSITTAVDSRAATEAEKDSDLNFEVIFWNGDNDPQNPLNWSNGIKVVNIGIVSALTFVAALSSSIFAPGVGQVMDEFDSHSDTLAEFVVSVYVLGFAIAPLLMAPFSEIYGRLVIYHISNIGFIVFSIACAVSTDMSMLIVFRFFQGCFGAAPLSNGGGSIADLIPPARRGAVMSIYGLGWLMGPIIGPLCGGYLAAAKGWRWLFWVLVIVEGFLEILSVLFLRETYAPKLLEAKARKLAKETGNDAIRSKLARDLTPRQLLVQASVRPVKMLALSPIIQLASLYMAVMYGYLYLMFTTFTFVFQGQYGISTANVGLTYLGLGVGSLLGLLVVGAASDRILHRLSRPSPRNPEGVAKPEFRLPLLIASSPLIPVGLFIYGWTAQYRVPWIAPIVGTAVVGAGSIGIFMPIQTYIVDAFGVYAASGLATVSVVRSVFGAILPLAGESMYNRLGLGWGNSLLGFIAVALLPVPVFFMTHGQRLRESFDTSRL